MARREFRPDVFRGADELLLVSGAQTSLVVFYLGVLLRSRTNGGTLRGVGFGNLHRFQQPARGGAENDGLVEQIAADRHMEPIDRWSLRPRNPRKGSAIVISCKDVIKKPQCPKRLQLVERRRMNLGSRSSPDSPPGSAALPPDPQRIILASNYYYSELYAGVLDYSRERGWLLDASMLYQPGFIVDPAGCAGVVACINAERHVEWIRSVRCPVVRLLHTSYELPSWPAVVLDCEAIGRLGAQHLLELGNTNFAYYRFHIDSPDTNECRDGFIREMEAHGRVVHSIDFGKLCSEATRPATPRVERIAWLKARLQSMPLPLAVMAVDDRYAVDLVLAARGIGRRIPEEIAILGAEDQPFIRGVVSEEISSIDVNFREVGRRACELLDRILQGATPGSNDVPMLVKVPPKEVMVRQSTTTFTCDHSGVTTAALFVRKHFHEAISVANVAAQAGMSVRSLQAEYPPRVGRTVKDDILRERLKRAQFLLERTDLKLAAVAVESGFGSPGYLCHIFQRIHRLTPNAWRQKYRRV